MESTIDCHLDDRTHPEARGVLSMFSIILFRLCNSVSVLNCFVNARVGGCGGFVEEPQEPQG